MSRLASKVASSLLAEISSPAAVISRELKVSEIAALANLPQLGVSGTELTDGAHEIDFAVHITGTVTKHADYERAPAPQLPLTSVLSAFIKRVCPRDSDVKQLLVEALVAASSDSCVVDDDDEYLKLVEESLVEFRKQMRALPVEKVVGETTVDCSFLALELPQLTAGTQLGLQLQSNQVMEMLVRSYSDASNLDRLSNGPAVLESIARERLLLKDLRSGDATSITEQE